MAQVTGYFKEKVDEIIGDSVVSASIDSVTGALTLQTRSGQTINAGSVGSTHDALDKAYPVGAIFMSTVALSPETQLGVGTWVAWGTGRVPVGVDANQTEFAAVEQTGGEKTHVLSKAEMPKHSHVGAAHTHTINHDHGTTTSKQVQWMTDGGSGSGKIVLTDIGNVSSGGGAGSGGITFNIPSYSGSSGPATTGNTGSSGGDADGLTQAHNNLQPYITCYMWKRTA